MTLALILLGVLLLATFLLLVLDDGQASLAGLSAIFTGVGALVVAILICFAFFGPRHDRRVCNEFADVSEREVRFEHYSFWEWECLVRTDEGWVGRDRIVKVDD